MILIGCQTWLFSVLCVSSLSMNSGEVHPLLLLLSVTFKAHHTSGNWPLLMSQRGAGHFSSWFMPLFLSSPKDVRPLHRSPKGEKKEDLEISVSCGTSKCQLYAECLAKQKTESEEDVRKRIETWILWEFPSSDFQKLSVVQTHLVPQQAGQTADNIYPGELMRFMFGMQLTTFDFQRCFPSRACAAVTLDPVGRVRSMLTKRNDAREREILTLSLLNHLWPSRSKLKACERQEHNTWIYISTCLRCRTDEKECMWECSHKMTNVSAFAKSGQIGRLRSLLVPLRTVNKHRWSVSGSQGCRGRDESCFFSVSVSTTWLTWRWGEKKAESIACRCAGRLYLSLVFAARRLPSHRSPSYLTLCSVAAA